MSDETQGAASVSPRFELGVFSITKSIFEMVPRAAVETAETRPERVNIGVQINASITTNVEVMRSIVTLDVFITPDPKWQPYRLEVVVTGGFHGHNVTAEQFDVFCRMSVPPILFPYAREAVHRMTMDAPNGPVRMDPINVEELLNSSDWSEGIRTVGGPEPIASTEPLQPSEQ